MSECPFCKAAVHEDASVCRGCGAERVKGYVSQQTMKFLAIVGTLLGIPAGFIVAFMTKSTPLMVITILALMLGPILFLKLKNKNNISWIRPTAR
ncbi:hypothetical protein HC231_05095 [Brenneria izadpanahii]|uniref:Zinc ribbon domain-containing protein n=1 Tax=Brenneria izadpanahii TaxID=2722756 RepID=A0ABX7UP94_9GAMM|nr:hypothetical protein [Brenneria izadpanahii]QTF07374.1 hypothetical protein HC231_05095 [Brenneria izadpanahii]